MEPTIQIYKLDEGYVLASELGSTACTNGSSLVKALKEALTQLADRGKVIQFPATQFSAAQEPSQGQVQAALTPTPADVTPPSDRATLRAVGELPPEQLQNLYRLADLIYTGQLSKSEDVAHNLKQYVPGLSPQGWSAFISEYIADRRAEDS